MANTLTKTTKRRPPRQKLPLRLVLIVPFLIQLMGAVGLVAYLSWRSGQEAICDLAFHLMEETGDRIATELSDHIDQARIVNDINEEAIVQGVLNLQDHDALNQYFLKQLKTFDDLTVVYWSSEAGEYIGAEHRPDGTYGLGITNENTDGNIEIYAVDDQNQPADLIHAAPYDPRKRPWYQLAVSAEQSTWTDIFVWAPLINMSIDLVQPVYEQGELLGVLGISVGLLDTNSLLREIQLGQSGQTYIVEPATGLLVATSAEQDPFVVSADGSTAERLPLDTDKLPWLSGATQFLETQFGDLTQMSESHQTRLKLDGRRYFLQVTPLTDSTGLDWVLVAVVPEADYTAQINANAKRTLGLSLVTLVIATGVGVLTARWISRPIAQMNRAARELSEDRWHNPAIAPSPIQEVEELTHSFQRMATALQESFTSLERKVNERTAELAESNEQLEAAKEKAEAANLTKSRFIANMSHELRTPLNAILGFTQLMHRDRQVTQTQRQHLDIIGRSGEHLLSLINDVLAISKIEAGHVTLTTAPFDIHRLLQTLEDMFHIKAANKGLSLTFDYPSELPRYLKADVGKLRQILMNLLSNAIKFTQQGSVTMRASALPEPQTDASIWIRFEVEDSGPGVPVEQHDHLFEAFVQAEAGQRSQEGTGLGLAICREYVELMGGCITVMANRSVGALFRVDLPMQLAQGYQHNQAVQRVIGLAAHQPDYRILVVDDQPTARQLLKTLLSSVGFQVTGAVDGEAAVAAYRQWQPHLIWMDMSMPVMDGYEATRQIRLLESELVLAPSAVDNQSSVSPLPKSASTKIIALSASAFDEDRSRMIAAGCDGFVRKPFQEQEIFDTMADHLGVAYRYETLGPADEYELTSQRLHYRTVPMSNLQNLSTDWVEQLQQAAIQADRDWLMQLIDQLPTEQRTLKERLTQLINRFDFDTLVDITERQRHAPVR
ncbi:MAG: ATP-binding protein [Cyanobacteria bacterium P01_D01_bin.14]